MRSWRLSIIAALIVAACSATTESPTPPLTASQGPVATPAATVLGSPRLVTPSPQPSATGGPTATVAAPTPTVAATPDALTAALQRAIDNWRQVSDAPAAVLGIRLPTGRTAIVASGQVNDVTGADLSTEDRFRIGSITKTFVAVVILQIEAQGGLKLNDRLSQYLPDAPHADQVTIRQLLDHTSGMPDFAVQSRYLVGILSAPGRRWTAEQTIDVIADRPLDFEPGTRWAYSNSNYVLLGMVAERVGGAPIAQLLRERIYQPLGLDSTFLEEMEEGPPLRVAGHYDLNGDGKSDNVQNIPYTAIVTSGAAAGGISATALDVLDFASGLWDGQLLAENSLNQMLAIEKPSTNYGLGIGRRRLGDQDAWGHAGAIPGFTAVFARADSGAIAVAMVNQSDIELSPLLVAAAKAADLP
jgi:D-alanyl-D-alanine carboxypeptidase